MELQRNCIEQSFNVRYSAWAREVLDELPDSFTITDPCISGHPIVFASREFLKMSGYSRHEVVGKNGRIFQGIKTNRRSVMEIREAVREERNIEISLLNYRKDGTPFWMLFHMCPVFSKEDGRVTHFVGVQVPIMRKPRRSGSGFVRNGVNLYDDMSSVRDTVIGSCRREVCSDTVAELAHVSALDSVLTDDREDPCKASDIEKRRAITAMNNIMSVLTHYSELTGRLVCGKRCCGMSPLCASLNMSLGRIKQSFVLMNPHLVDTPIVYASDAFLELTGYARHEVLGRNCRFLSGKDTDLSTQFQIKESIESEQACTVCILNYRKDESTFQNFLHISPVRNATGKHLTIDAIFNAIFIMDHPKTVSLCFSTEVAYFVEVQLEANFASSEDKEETILLRPDRRQLGVVGAVKVAVRTSSMAATTSNS